MRSYCSYLLRLVKISVCLGVDFSHKAIKNESSSNTKSTQKKRAKVNFDFAISFWLDPSFMKKRFL